MEVLKELCDIGSRYQTNEPLLLIPTRYLIYEESKMENIMSGSFTIDEELLEPLSDEEIDESLEILMQDDQFEQDLINSFNTKMYTINDKSPNPMWSYCSVSMRMICLYPRTELTVLNEIEFNRSSKNSLIECLVGINLVKIPKNFIDEGDWH